MAIRLLIVKLSSMGDVIHTLPAAQMLRAAFPQAHLGWAVERAHAAVIRNQPWLDEVVEWDRNGARNWLDFVRRLRSPTWDIAVDFQGLFRSALVTRLSGARLRVGFAPSRECSRLFYTQRARLTTMDRHAVERSAELAASLGGVSQNLPLERPYLAALANPAADFVNAPPPRFDEHRSIGPALFPLHPSAEDRAAVAAWSARHGFDPTQDRLVVLNPHCRREANRWPASHFTDLARGLLGAPGVRVALAGGPVARSLCDEIAAPLGDRVWRADGEFSLLASALLFSKARAIVTGDTGPMHLAAAVSTPIVALFGASNPLRTGPYTNDCIALSERLACSPCLARRCPLRHDPPLCMAGLTPQRVLAAVLARLGLPATTPLRKSA